MKLTVIIPCHPRNRPTLPRTLESLERAASAYAARGKVEQVVVGDPDARGLSWARNRGLDRATGEAVLFADADDTVRPDFFIRHAELLSDADFALTATDYQPLKRDYTLAGNAAIRAAMLPAFFGYSLADVERWNRGGELAQRREQGGVWRGIYRREFLDRWQIRFDENLRLYEDSPFLAECAARAERVNSADEHLYEYAPGAGGILAQSHGGEAYWRYKFAALANRKAIAARVGGGVMEHFAASAVFSALEFLKARRFAELKRYLADDFVRTSLRAFPLSPRHPLCAAAVTLLRMQT